MAILRGGKTSHEGLVLALGEHNWHDDSDFFALVWDEAKGEPVEFEYATTRFPTYENTASVDATPEVLAKWKAWREAREAAARKAAEELAARTPAKGKLLRVVRGRKVPVGTEGECVWYGAGRRFHYYCAPPMRVGLKTASGETIWTAASNVVVLIDGEPAPGSDVPAPKPPKPASSTEPGEASAKKSAAAKKAAATRAARKAAETPAASAA